MSRKLKLLIAAIYTYTWLLGVSSVNAQSVATSSEDLNGWLQLAIDVLSAAVGVAFVLSFIVAGYQYMTARDDVNQLKAAKDRIVTLVLTFFVFAFGYALLQWLVPGGIFS